MSSFTANVAACQELLGEVQESLHLRGWQSLDESVEQVRSNLSRLRRQHDAAIEQLRQMNLALQTRHNEDKTGLEDAQARMQRRDATIDEQKRTIRHLTQAREDDVRKARNLGFQEGYRAGQERIRSLEATNQALSAAGLQKDQKIRTLKRGVERAEISIAKAVADAYQRGVGDGQQAEQNRNRPPPPPPQPVVDILGREDLLKEIKLSSPGHTMSANLEGAIKQGLPDVLSTVLQFERPSVRAPALHMAAVFGDVATAELLLKAGANVNESCQARAENGGHLYGVTPMHFAVAAQHESIIRLLYRYGAHFSFGMAPSHKDATAAPAFWLLSDRWLRLSRKSDSRHVLRTLATMKDCSWSSREAVNKTGEMLSSVAYRNLSGRPDLQRDVLNFLQ